MESKKVLSKYLYKILTIGLILGLAFMLAGYVYAIASGISLKLSPDYFSKDLNGIISEVKNFTPLSVSYIGLLILNFTPTAGVIFSIFYFLKNKQYRFFLIGIVILAILSVGAIIGIMK